MGRPSARITTNTVSLGRKAWANVKGLRTPTTTTTDGLAASVQPMSGERKQLYDLDAGVTAWTVYFASDPTLAVGDEITWGTRVLSVLAPARDQAGRGVAWAVDCKSVNQE